MKLKPDPKRRAYRVQCAECAGPVTVSFFYKGKRYISSDPAHDLCRKCYQSQKDRMREAG